MPTPPTPPTLRQDEWRRVIGLTLLAVLPRLLFVHFQTVPAFDPWRHLALVRNIREGLGFTLFDGQPYIWYSPLWYYVCAALPPGLGMDWLAAIFSALSVPVLYLALHGLEPRVARGVPLLAAGLLALSGPATAYTCHYGSEGAALFLTLSALLLAWRFRSTAISFLAGLLFGTALMLRLNFAFNVFLFLPLARRMPRAVAFGIGTGIPLAITWWRNHGIISRFPFVFTWDGLATPTDGFGLLSTLMIQMHPDVAEGLRRLHERIIPLPEWLGNAQGPSWGLLVLMLACLLGLLFSRRPTWILTGFGTLAYFFVADRTLSSNFFRIYLALFPVFFMGIAVVTLRLWSRPGLWKAAGAALALAALFGGAALWIPGEGVPLDRVTPPASLLESDRYMVNSTRYHPESLVFRFPEKRFIGLPLNPDRLEPFREAYPEFDRLLWHDFSVQDEVLRSLIEAGYAEHRRARNAGGTRYLVLRALGKEKGLRITP